MFKNIMYYTLHFDLNSYLKIFLVWVLFDFYMYNFSDSETISLIIKLK